MIGEVNHIKDRKWQVICETIANPSYLELSVWSFYVNDWNKPMDFQCQESNVITGIGDIHKNNTKERRYKFRCTYMAHWKRGNCKWSSSIGFDSVWYQHTPSGKFLVGVRSEHDNSKE